MLDCRVTLYQPSLNGKYDMNDVIRKTMKFQRKKFTLTLSVSSSIFVELFEIIHINFSSLYRPVASWLFAISWIKDSESKKNDKDLSSRVNISESKLN